MVSMPFHTLVHHSKRSLSKALSTHSMLLAVLWRRGLLPAPASSGVPGGSTLSIEPLPPAQCTLPVRLRL